MLFRSKSDYAIPSNSVAEIYSADILGSKSIRIDMGSSNLHVTKNDTIKGKCEPDMISMITKDIIPLKEHLTQIMANMNTLLENVNNLLDSNAVTNLQSSFGNLNATLANTKKLSNSFNGFVPELQEILDNFNKLSNAIAQSGDDINNSFKNLNQITSELAEADIKNVIDNLNNLLVKLQDTGTMNF